MLHVSECVREQGLHCTITPPHAQSRRLVKCFIDQATPVCRPVIAKLTMGVEWVVHAFSQTAPPIRPHPPYPPPPHSSLSCCPAPPSACPVGVPRIPANSVRLPGSEDLSVVSDDMAETGSTGWSSACWGWEEKGEVKSVVFPRERS